MHNVFTSTVKLNSQIISEVFAMVSVLLILKVPTDRSISPCVNLYSSYFCIVIVFHVSNAFLQKKELLAAIENT